MRKRESRRLVDRDALHQRIRKLVGLKRELARARQRTGFSQKRGGVLRQRFTMKFQCMEECHRGCPIGVRGLFPLPAAIERRARDSKCTACPSGSPTRRRTSRPLQSAVLFLVRALRRNPQQRCIFPMKLEIVRPHPRRGNSQTRWLGGTGGGGRAGNTVLRSRCGQGPHTSLRSAQRYRTSRPTSGLSR